MSHPFLAELRACGPRRCIKHLRLHVSLVQLVGIVVCLPPLIFPDQAPVWLIPSAILGLALTFWAGRWLAGRALAGRPGVCTYAAGSSAAPSPAAHAPQHLDLG
jgi:hypothetical protein